MAGILENTITSYFVGSDKNLGLNADTTVNGDLNVLNSTLICTSTNESSTSDPRVDLKNLEISPETNDSCGTLRFHANNDAGQEIMYSGVSSVSTTITDGAENGEIRLKVMNHGTQNTLALRCIGQTAANTVECSFPQSGGLGVGTNSTKQGTLTLHDGAGGNTPAWILLHSCDGTAGYIFLANDGTLRKHTAAPTANTDGTAV